jgi:general secretion pathway protein M
VNALKQWWDQASTRDQIALAILAFALALYILFMAILKPVANMASEQKQRVASQQAAYERVKSLAAQWVHSQKSDRGKQSREVERIVEGSISQHGLRVAGFDPSGRNGIRVRFDQIAYDKFLAWVYDLEMSQGVRLKDVTVAASSEEGLVSANVLIQK